MAEPHRVRVTGELMLDAGSCETVLGPDGPERLIRPPATTLFHQVLAYLREKPDPPKPPSGSMVGREGIAAAALVLRWGSYLAVLLDHDKPVWAEADSPGTSRISDEEMARINIEASAALAHWIDVCRSARDRAVYEQLVNRAACPASPRAPPPGSLFAVSWIAFRSAPDPWQPKTEEPSCSLEFIFSLL
jgi:hypothetical protein